MGIWRHVILRQPGWWGMVFTLGMYSAATAAVSRALDAPAILDDIAFVFAWIALLVWAATFATMLVTL